MSWAAGVITGVVFVFAIALLSCRSRHQTDSYDERQIAVRGTAYKAGFLTMVLCNLIPGILMAMLDTGFFRKYEMVLFIGSAFLGLTVFAVIAIWKGAYLTAHQNPVKNLIIVIMVISANALAAFYKPDWETPEELFSSVHGINALIAVFFLIILAALVLKMIQERRENV